MACLPIAGFRFKMLGLRINLYIFLKSLGCYVIRGEEERRESGAEGVEGSPQSRRVRRRSAEGFIRGILYLVDRKSGRHKKLTQRARVRCKGAKEGRVHLV